ncbi:U3 small nucleolar RNA-associated protein 21 [Sporothrix brasiliensis 5110]|uniref:U3 small nucleolar RNA-associated protein 21 n=1 Tax=Sporothrix brasiliensis 5110 TaxID=1398154 RepID=A0A0C2IPN5_9PEZI|nr:U3 small nucleolar RNA-associated protein 21 [Sporothrix brasiliensis 5110]KIH88895.1 U3 small nucleolar RNA-associated protein 21 [Sporothrix brasiliensis 5110]
MPHSESGAPLVKRQKLSTAPASSAQQQSSAIATGSNIFAPFRTVGLVSPTAVPFTSIPLGKTTFQITTSAGRCLQTYDLKRGLNLVFVTRPQTPRHITATYAWKHKVYAAWGGKQDGDEENEDDDDDDDDDDDEDSSNNGSDAAPPNTSQGVWIFQRGRKVGELPMPRDLTEPIRQISIFGAWIVGLARTRIDVWKSTTLEHYTTLQPTATTPGSNELTGGMCTMPTFLNKLFVGRADGWVEIWNVSSGKLVYTILPPQTASPPGGVTCLEPTPALGLLAIAYAAGPLVIHDVLRDQPLIHVEAGTAGVTADGENDAPVTSISFRTDGRGAGQDGRVEGVMATATTASGDVTFWDLNKGGRIMGVLRSAHNPPSRAAGGVRGGISKIEFLAGQPVILTSGLDNSLRSWIFDETPFSPIPRILHTRSGHAAPVNCLAFLPSDFDGADAGNKWLLSGGLDRSLWGWSLRRDGQSSELSQGSVRQKAKKLGILSTSALRHGPTTTLEDLKAPPITCIASSLNRDGGIGALPGKMPIWLKIGGPHGNGGHKNKAGRAGEGLRPGDTESSSMTGWESVVTAHRDDAYARTWFWGRKRAGRWQLCTGDNRNVSTVAISPCGTFALVGSEGGSIDMYNLQSGIHRQRFPSRLTPAQARQLKVQQQLRQADGVTQLQATATTGHGTFAGFRSPGAGRHAGAVTGVVVDNLNSVVVSCSLDGTVKFWDFLTGHLVDQINEWGGVPVTACRYHAANDLLAFACGDNTIRVVDLVTRKTIRVFRAGAANPPSSINDLCFSSDGRWVVAVTQDDARLRVWDLPTSHLIDSVPLDRPGRAVAFSGTGEYLAVAPDGALGVHLWTNKTLFKHVPTRPVVEAPTASTTRKALTDKKGRKKAKAVVAGPTVSGEGGAGQLEGAFVDDGQGADGEDSDDILPAKTLDQLSADMTTLSLVPKARWQTLLHLDLIKQRNRPREAPKVPEKAPFFLGTVGSAEAEKAGLGAAYANGQNQSQAGADGTDGKDGSAGDARSRILTLDLTRAQQALTLKLHQGKTGNFAPFVDHLKSLPPAQADLELRSLAADEGELALFVRAMTSRLRARRDYELVQAWMTVFLRLHGSTAVEAAVGGGDEDGSESNLDDFAAALAEWRVVQEQERSRLDALVGYCGGVVGFLRNPRS